ncbi:MULTISPECIES: efflux transporter outer membrane subunit [Nitrosomonas]|uniref:Multidrug efflux system outer membrane protein n=1 Tax=Nitrosomonas communis TaxID=44574 RepID=A0A0F7KGM1_9PROT|nr:MULTISPECIES: efflux transporter outer membrane subunit [Nitrosomonas]AKH37982.1 hypothetical protein AAW31_09415 [Nitrosomonas communis]TYP91586.1 multidrug efflux system outer membrane protein [Nitrosomonas communis]UVS59863.1 efflux transporter outer membrane subunit [Nitrosomonas sp. PLL12]
MNYIILPLFAATLLSACAVGPDYRRPVIETPEKWRVDYPQAAEVTNVGWWTQFGDPALNALIETALNENRDIQAAAARVDQFIGALQATRAQFFPQIGYSATISRNRATEELAVLPPGNDPYFSLYRGALNASWQIDLFGRIRRQSEAAQAQIFASEQGRRGVILSVVTSVAASYIGLRALDRQLEIARASAANYAETMRIFDLRYQWGVVSQTELSQIQSQYQLALATIPGIEQQIVAQENLISILLGRNPETIPRGSTIDELIAPIVPPDLPSTLLERRPDIVEAEQNLVATNANVGVARSLYYPTITLTGLLGSASTAFGNFLTGPASTWTVAAGLLGPIFTFGNITGQVRAAEAAQREAIAFYQAIILNAFRETNDALIGAVKKREEAEAQAKRVVALKEYARLSRAKFDNGYAGYLEVLFAENLLFDVELAAVRSKADRYTELVNVYKATGGGWVDEAEQLTPKPQLKGVQPVLEGNILAP